MKLYFAHAKEDYNTEYEQKCLELIRDQYPRYEIINPKDIKIEGDQTDPKDYTKFMARMNRIYFPEILKCYVLIAVVSSNTGNLTQGVRKEIEFALRHNLKVSNLDGAQFLLSGEV